MTLVTTTSRLRLFHTPQGWHICESGFLASLGCTGELLGRSISELPARGQMAGPTLGKDLSAKFDQPNTGPAPDLSIPRHSVILQNDLVDQLHEAVIALD